MNKNLIKQLKEEWNQLDPIDPLRGLISDAIDALKEKTPPCKPLTINQLREHWEGAKVLDMTDAEIGFADYVFIVRDVEALYGIKGKA